MGVNNNIKTLAAVINVNGKHDDVHLKQGLVCQIMSLKNTNHQIKPKIISSIL